ncbi:MAG: winged helix-turn-helix domain-containing protein [Alphaproteobacteria bacterium]|nr:winged helix-turn-helix domain-containing protein [Alphaproteobacteria bacterium]
MKMIESGPILAAHDVVRWRLVDLCQWIWEEFWIIVAKQTLCREPRTTGYRNLSATPHHHAQVDGAIADLKNIPRASGGDRLKKGLDQIEIRFAAEARTGQKNKITTRWARGGTRPSVPRDRRTASTHIFDAICPKERKALASSCSPATPKPRRNKERKALRLTGPERLWRAAYYLPPRSN